MKANYKVSVNTHGVEWFSKGMIDENGNHTGVECPECQEYINTSGDDNHVAFEHPKKTGTNYVLKCQCLVCGCVFSVTRSEKSIRDAYKDDEE